jgi:hypothetical protein
MSLHMVASFYASFSLPLCYSHTYCYPYSLSAHSHTALPDYFLPLEHSPPLYYLPAPTYYQAVSPPYYQFARQPWGEAVT